MADLPNVRIHDLRHTYASSAAGMGVSLPIIGNIIGHTQFQTTARYAHLAPSPVQSAANQIAAEIARSMEIA
jgi:site-specific recombinase XerD